ncbi:acyl-CoA carboxylase epsilon subunit [Streptomyces mirabilis]|uniref:acyl-CoA carboxylase epsilon subunit n=1 Tax=Streptomyces mirabilis TaxID=68239 RepID=UPI0036471EE5
MHARKIRAGGPGDRLSRGHRRPTVLYGQPKAEELAAAVAVFAARARYGGCPTP